MFDSIKKLTTKFGIGKKGILQRYIDTFTKNKLDADESLLACAAPNKPTELLFVTDKRVFYYVMGTEDTTNDRIISYDQIESCEIQSESQQTELIVNLHTSKVQINQVEMDVAIKVKKLIDSQIS
ncbi:PH domain-containing protein [Aquibacillus sediminis]|uniref:PH domain-containing protein n=1 Tax=Aquibacillus sediminis TaxID=2574734 RepID=UPI001108C876|nr:PH domain-containing protein [Aquibacillus sediminis]